MMTDSWTTASGSDGKIYSYSDTAWLKPKTQ